MKGIKEYIKKHGRHLTEELAYEVAGSKWKIDKIQAVLSTMVWYNVTGTTSGDLIYMVNTVYAYYHPMFNIRGVCRIVADLVGDYTIGKEFAFDSWLARVISSNNKDFDLSLYI